jgi:epoxyqueuosine reductase
VTASLKTELALLARTQGFHDLRVTTPDAIGPAGERLRQFLADHRHGDMDWMERNADRRAAPEVLWPEARSVLMLGYSYAPANDPLAILDQPLRGAISCYSQGKDYHDVVKRGLIVVARKLAELTAADVKVFVDTAPLMEKPLAAAAGLGWQGKHTNLVSRTAGSWMFLGAILTTACIDPDPPEEDHCGSCSRCLDICPTNAFPAPYQLDARRCIAYLTIEYKGHIPAEMRKPIGNRVFGCDDCLAVCPWNKFAESSREIRFSARDGTASPPLADLLSLDDASFRQRFAGTPVKRTGRDRVVRNALIAAGNSEDPSLLPQVLRLLDDASPLVRAMAVWAHARLAPAAAPGPPRRRPAAETDPHVRAEWQALNDPTG